jgi:short-subunit dehydrogenase
MPRKSARRRPTTSGRLALITGASAGIGREMARVFAREGHDLVVVARRKGRLLELKRELEQEAGVRVRVIEADLGDPEAPAKIHRALARQQVEFLVNNAGTLEGGEFAKAPAERVGQMLALNVGALTRMTHAFLPPMLRRGRGRVVNIASIAAFAPVPWLAVYAATKSYVLSLSEALAEELQGTGVGVTAVCPGLTDSEMADAALERARALTPYRRLLFAQAATVAEAAYAGCMAGDALVVPGAPNRLYDRLMQVTPRGARRKLTGLMGRAMR